MGVSEIVVWKEKKLHARDKKLLAVLAIAHFFLLSQDTPVGIELLLPEHLY